MLKSHLGMLLGFFEGTKATGSAFNSSKWAAKALITPLRASTCPKTILEVGAGTGPVTEEILNDMHEGDRLMIVEVSPRMMKINRERVQRHKNYHLHANNIRFFQGYIQDLPEDWRYDIIVCALPFLNFDLETTKEIFDKFHRISADDTVMTWYEYIGLRRLGKVVAHPDRKKLLRTYDRFFKEISAKHELDRERVWLNILPINIYTMKMEELGSAHSPS